MAKKPGQTGIPEIDNLFTDEEQPDLNRWAVVDGIKFNQARTIRDEDGLVVLTIAIGAPKEIGDHPVNAGRIFPILVKRFEDGTVRELLINFGETHELDYQLGDENDPNKSGA